MIECTLIENFFQSNLLKVKLNNIKIRIFTTFFKRNKNFKLAE